MTSSSKEDLRVDGDINNQTQSVIILTLAAGAMGAVNFAFGLFVARLAGEKAWSAVAPMLAAGTAGSFVGLGFEYAVSRAIVLRYRMRIVMRWAALACVSGTVLIVVSRGLSTPVARFLHLGSSEPVELSTALFCITVLAAFPSGLLVGQKRFAALATMGIIGSLSRVGFLWATSGSWVNRSLSASVAATALAALAMLALGLRRGIGGQPAAARSNSPVFGRYALGGAAAQLALWAIMVAPVVAARHFLPLRNAGELATVTFVASGLVYLAAPVATVFFPAMVADPSRALVIHGLAGSVAIVLAGGAVVIGVGPYLISLLYGRTQAHLTTLLALGALAVLAQTVSGFLAWAALARRKQVRGVLVGCAAALPLVGLLALWHSSAGALLVGSLPATAALGAVCSLFRGLTPPAVPVGLIPGGDCQVLKPSSRILGVPRPSTPVSVGIMAYNEEGTVGEVVRRFLDEPPGLVEVAEVFVVASGCSDTTAAVARQAGRSDPRLSVVEEPQRNGKLAAISVFFRKASSEIAIVSGADTIPEPGALQELCRPLVDSADVGMAGPRVIPLPRVNAAQRLHEILWELHHRVALEAPKLGEIVAIRHRGLALYAVAGCDEVIMEHAVSSKGLRLAYAPGAVVHNRSPATVREYYLWRQRLAVQHYCAASNGMRVSTMSWSRCSTVAVSLIVDEPGALIGLATCGILEIFARVSGSRAARHGATMAVWDPTVSTRTRTVSSVR